MSSESACAICLESLISEKPIGATSPCGHCMHVECWNGWVASCLGSRDCKCPMCNNPAHSFVRLFVDFGVLNDDDDGESLSLSSDDESLEDENSENSESLECARDTEQSTESSNDSVTERTVGSAVFVYQDQDDSEQEADEPSGIVIDEAPALNHQHKEECRKTKKRAGLSGEINVNNKYKQMAKRYKIRVSMLESQRKEQGEEQQKLLRKITQDGEDLRHANDKLITYRKESVDHERFMENQNLRLVQLHRELAEKSALLKSAQQAASKAKQQLSEEMERYQRRLSRVSAASMNEVQQMLDERPKLVNQIRTLNEKVLRLQRRLDNVTGGRSVENPDAKNVKRKGDESHAAMKKLLRAMDDGHESHLQSARENKEKQNGKIAKTIPPHFERVRASARAGLSDSRDPSALAALDAIDNISRIEPILPSFLLQMRLRQSTSLSTSASSSQISNRVRFTSASQQRVFGREGKKSLK